jgi:hypothetical protein
MACLTALRPLATANPPTADQVRKIIEILHLQMQLMFGLSPNHHAPSLATNVWLTNPTIRLRLGKLCVVLHNLISNGGLWILCAAMYGVGRGIPACEHYLGKHGATSPGLYPDMVARDREKQRPFVATEFLK